MTDNAFPMIMAISLVLGVATGFIMHRSDFCLAGMFRDLFIFRQNFMLRILALAVVASMALFEAARQAGFLLYPFPLFGPPSLANVAGGLAFGVGMVLAGGCVVGTLYKMGSGSLLSAIAFAGLIAGSALYAEIHPLWTQFALATTIFKGMVTIPQIVGVDSEPVVVIVAFCSFFLFYRWFREGNYERRSHAEGYLQPWKAALLLALVGFSSAVTLGMPLGITTAYAKLGAYLEGFVFPAHLAGLTYFKAIPLDYICPINNTRLLGGAGPRIDAIAAIQFPLILGIIAGGTLSAHLLGEFKVYLKVPFRQCISALAGGIIMGLASRMVPGCNVWHLLGGLPILAGQSVLFLLGLLPGAWIGSRILTKWVVQG
jgi:uncharacterized protein